jgi:hypothetical protein
MLGVTISVPLVIRLLANCPPLRSRLIRALLRGLPAEATLAGLARDLRMLALLNAFRTGNCNVAPLFAVGLEGVGAEGLVFRSSLSDGTNADGLPAGTLTANESRALTDLAGAEAWRCLRLDHGDVADGVPLVFDGACYGPVMLDAERGHDFQSLHALFAGSRRDEAAVIGDIVCRDMTKSSWAHSAATGIQVGAALLCSAFLMPFFTVASVGAKLRGKPSLPNQAKNDTPPRKIAA